MAKPKHKPNAQPAKICGHHPQACDELETAFRSLGWLVEEGVIDKMIAYSAAMTTQPSSRHRNIALDELEAGMALHRAQFASAA